MPVDWNEAYVKGDTPWDKGEPSPPLREFLSGQVIAGKVLVPGCGTGHDVRLLAENGADAMGLDLAPEAVRRAQSLSLETPASGRMRFAQGDFLCLPPDYHNAFDWVVEHTCLCALDPVDREAYARSVVRALKPRGHFLAVFYRDVPDYNGDGPPHPISEAEIRRLFGEDFKILQSFVPRETYASRSPGSEEVVCMRLAER